MATIDTIRPIKQNFKAYANDNWIWSVSVYSDDALTTPVDLTVFDTMELKVRVVRGEGLVLVTADLATGLAVSANLLSVDVNFTVEDRGLYEFDIEGVTSSGEIATIVQGQVDVTLDV